MAPVQGCQIREAFCIKKNKTLFPLRALLKMKRQAVEWGKIFTIHVSDKGVVSIMHKELLKLKPKT